MIPLNRFGPGILLRKLKRWFEAYLDPQRVVDVFDEFDRARGFAAWQTYCRTRLERALPDDADRAPVVERGYTTLPVMSANAAAELLQAASADQGIARLKRDSAKLEGYELDDPALVARLLEASLCDAVDAQALSFFRSEYMVYWYTLSRTEPNNEPASV